VTQVTTPPAGIKVAASLPDKDHSRDERVARAIAWPSTRVEFNHDS